jgi:long-chain acyl-CoA synthetase
VKGCNVMKGYYKNDEETEKVLSSEGWWKTGDLGLVDEDRSIFIKGPSKNV